MEGGEKTKYLRTQKYLPTEAHQKRGLPLPPFDFVDASSSHAPSTTSWGTGIRVTSHYMVTVAVKFCCFLYISRSVLF